MLATVHDPLLQETSRQSTRLANNDANHANLGKKEYIAR